MSPKYPIMDVHADWKTEPEQMGSKQKFWFRRPNDPDGREWLFKFPTKNTGEHWAEKIAYEIARKMRIVAPAVGLAQYRAPNAELRRGSVTRRFPSEYELYHGNQILAGLDPHYTSEQKFKQRIHTVQRIFASMRIFKSDSVATQYRGRLAEYFIFDAVIGNVDRHHENWGVLRKRVLGEWRGRLAPTFDHASSLGRELLDTGGKRSRERYLCEVGIDKYTEKARGAIFIAERPARAPSPLELVRWCAKQADHRQFFEKASARLDLLDSETVEEIISKVPATWMTSTARAFARDLVCYNRDQLREIFR